MQTQVNEDRLDAVVLAWLWCQRGKPATPAGATTGVKAMLPPGAAGELLPAALERLVQAGHVERIEPAKKAAKPTFRITTAGERRARDFLRREDLPAGARPFGTIGSYALPALAAGLPVPAADKKALAASGKLLHAALCARHHRLDVPLDRGPDEAKLALVKLALSKSSNVPAERIHLKELPTGVLPALVAGPLLGAPGTAATNLDKLLESSAVGIFGVSKPAQIKPALVGRWIRGEADGPARAAPAPEKVAPAVVAEAAPDVDLATFARQALTAAREVARAGRDGVSNLGDQVLIHYAWRRYQQTFGHVPLERFKQRLSEANGDQIVLVREDLVPEARAQEFRESEVRTAVSSYHYIRI